MIFGKEHRFRSPARSCSIMIKYTSYLSLTRSREPELKLKLQLPAPAKSFGSMRLQLRLRLRKTGLKSWTCLFKICTPILYPSPLFYFSPSNCDPPAPPRKSGDTLYGIMLYPKGVCSIFLRVDRSLNEIHKPRAILPIKVFNKKYVFI